jgi:hypothetical protein
LVGNLVCFLHSITNFCINFHHSHLLLCINIQSPPLFHPFTPLSMVNPLCIPFVICIVLLLYWVPFPSPQKHWNGHFITADSSSPLLYASSNMSLAYINARMYTSCMFQYPVWTFDVLLFNCLKIQSITMINSNEIRLTLCVTMYCIFMNNKPSVLHRSAYSWTNNRQLLCPTYALTVWLSHQMIMCN